MNDMITQTDHRPLLRKLLLLVAAASVFGFALVPLYNVLCRATGLNGKSYAEDGFSVGGLRTSIAAPSAIDRTRVVTVEFTGTVMPGLPWEMRPLTHNLETHPGEMQQVRFLVRNTSDRTVVSQAIPSISPGQAAQNFEKIECFCFTQQTLAPGESREMPVAFIIKPALSKDIRNITLSYSFYAVDSPSQAGAEQRKVQ
jgi:cytochrome c oxidase assembly protein subunit 11